MAKMEIGSIALQVNRKPIKNLHISVLPPDGRVRVSAPKTMSETAIRMAVIGRIPWIKKQQADFAKQPRQSPREMISGECHYLWGERYRLNVVEHSNRRGVKIGRGRIFLYISEDASIERRASMLTEHYRELLKEEVTKLLGRWQKRIGVSPTTWQIRKMKTKWGSCSTDSRRITINLELAKKPIACLEYILVHELIHLLERRHNERFKSYIDKYLPDWRERRTLLNQMPLAHEDWQY